MFVLIVCCFDVYNVVLLLVVVVWCDMLLVYLVMCEWIVVVFFESEVYVYYDKLVEEYGGVW